MAWRTKKINGDDLGKTAFKPGEINLELCTPATFGISFQGKFGKAPSLSCNLSVISTSGFLEQSFHFLVRETVNKTRFTEGSLTAAFDDLA
jgi:hypothetical protein